MRAGSGKLRGYDWVVVLALATVVLGSCNHKADLGPPVERTTPELIKQINNNNSQIRNLWARLDITLQTPDEKHSLDGHLLLRKPEDVTEPPRELLLKGSAGLGAASSEIGSNNSVYWYKRDAPGDEHDLYNCQAHGDESSGSPGLARDLLSVLGVYELPDDPGCEPWPVLRGYEAPPYYVLSFIDKVVGGAKRVRKDLWWNRRTQKVDLIELFNARGHRYLSAALDEYQDFGGAQIATKLHIVWHEEKSQLDLKLKAVETNNPRKVTDRAFEQHKPAWAQPGP